MRHWLKNGAYLFCYGLRNVLDPILHFQEISVLAYHSISDAGLDTAIAPVEFSSQMEFLKSKGFSFVSLGAILEWLEGKGSLPRKAVALTFDDGYADFETAAVPILERFAAPATVFVVGDGNASRKALQNDIPLLSAQALERVCRRGLVEIGFHSMTHASVGVLTGAALRRELISPFPARFFAYSGGNYSEEAMEEARKVGYAAAFSIKRRLVRKDSNRYLLPRSVITRDMQLWEVKLRSTKAIEWYRSVATFFKAATSAK